MKWLVTALVVVALAGTFLVEQAVTGAGSAAKATATVHLTIRHSRFEPDHVVVPADTTVTFVVDNTDPIGHELIIGDAGVQERHEKGTEPYHPPRPGEVSVPAGTTQQTTFTFGTANGITYACHLPGHFAYGMHGTVDVTSR